MFNSYAQNFEDVILWRALKHVENGCYVDIGANDPVVDSVSLAFYERGWRGVHVEPMPAFAAKLRATRPDEVVVEAAIGLKIAPTELFEFEGTGLTTSHEAIAKQHRRGGRRDRGLLAPTRTLASVLADVGRRDIHWLKIDVEGMEEDVLRSWEGSDARPWVLVIESTVPGKSEENCSGWEHLVLERGYKYAYFDGLNRFYTHISHSELAPSFGPGPNFFDEFVLSEASPFVVTLRERLDAESALRQRLSEALSKIENMECSLSWRGTAPLRSFGGRIRSLVDHARSAFKMSVHRGLEIALWLVRRTPVLKPLVFKLTSSTPALQSRLVRFGLRNSHIGNYMRQIYLDAAMVERLKWRNPSFPELPNLTTSSDQSAESAECAADRVKRIYYWIDHTCIYSANTGIQRVVRSLATALLQRGIRLIPVKWDVVGQTFVPASKLDLEHMARWNGPAVSAWSAFDGFSGCGESDWLLIAELVSGGSAPRIERIHHRARAYGVRIGWIFYDAIPHKLEELYPPEVSEAHRDYMKALHDADLIFAISDYARRDFLQFSLEQSCGGINLLERTLTCMLPAEFPGTPRRTSVSRAANGPVKILCVGTVEPRKNHLTLLAGFKMLRDVTQLPEVQLTIVGGNPHPDLEKEIDKLLQKTSGATWIKSTSDDELNKLYDTCDFTVYPSVEEGFGLPVLESLWHGRPCICRNASSMVELAQGGGCLTVETFSATELANAMRSLVCDVSLRANLAAEACARSFRTWADYAQDIHHHLNRAHFGKINDKP